MHSKTAVPRDEISKYFEVYVMPYLVEHMRMRGIGIQVFTAVQAGLMVAWATRPHWALPLLGLASCLSAQLWDGRNRYIFTKLHTLGEELVDKPMFGEDPQGRAVAGMHIFFLSTLSKSGRILPGWGAAGGLASHTWAIRIIILSSTLVWIALIISAIL